MDGPVREYVMGLIASLILLVATCFGTYAAGEVSNKVNQTSAIVADTRQKFIGEIGRNEMRKFNVRFDEGAKELGVTAQLMDAISKESKSIVSNLNSSLQTAMTDAFGSAGNLLPAGIGPTGEEVYQAAVDETAPKIYDMGEDD